jgi:hypothetical protein
VHAVPNYPIHLDNFLLNGSGSASAVKLIEEHILKTELIESYFPRLPWIECIQLVQFSLFIMPDLNNILPLLSELNANKIDIPLQDARGCCFRCWKTDQL